MLSRRWTKFELTLVKFPTRKVMVYTTHQDILERDRTPFQSKNQWQADWANTPLLITEKSDGQKQGLKVVWVTIQRRSQQLCQGSIQLHRWINPATALPYHVTRSKTHSIHPTWLLTSLQATSKKNHPTHLKDKLSRQKLATHRILASVELVLHRP